ncbi:hypothetical protein C8J57DRAFT_1535226 [Mycena rebaudengoi]|nr:hypothetical protein C8J57DRAFT_1535226 [Mycena rebaudengoi]
MLTALPRIDILAATRNLAIESLVERGGYDRLLFSNDMFVEISIIDGCTTYGALPQASHRPTLSAAQPKRIPRRSPRHPAYLMPGRK